MSLAPLEYCTPHMELLYTANCVINPHGFHALFELTYTHIYIIITYLFKSVYVTL